MSSSHSHRHHDDHAHGKEHSHGHHHHGHHHAPTTYNRAFAIGIALNITFVLIEAYFGWQADSLSLLADAGHNLSDVLGLVLAWSAMFVGKLQGNDRHTYGWRRASILAALINALVLLVAMGAMAWEAIHRLQQPVPVVGSTMMWVAGIGVLINGITAWFFMRGGDSDINIRGAFLHMASDALVSLGVVVAGFAYIICGWSWLDPVMSLIIALVIIAGTWGLLRQSLHLSLDGVPEHIDLAKVREYFMSLADVRAVHDLHIWAMSSSEVALTVHLVMPEGHGHDAFLQEVTEELHDHFDIDHPTIQIVAMPFTRACSSPTSSPLIREHHSH
ncbi:cation transporter [Moraxellaceae bacterium AER2_44_116]|nr:cation transporter [Moraxellaceae bacterium]TQC97171.1 cation transporter [Moraxellaceae bacterium AER2_44_116]